jgi:hypothetical protein
MRANTSEHVRRHVRKYGHDKKNSSKMPGYPPIFRGALRPPRLQLGSYLCEVILTRFSPNPASRWVVAVTCHNLVPSAMPYILRSRASPCLEGQSCPGRSQHHDWPRRHHIFDISGLAYDKNPRGGETATITRMASERAWPFFLFSSPALEGRKGRAWGKALCIGISSADRRVKSRNRVLG